jgi:hypothetical protein
MDLRTKSDYFPVQHYLIGFYNRDGVYLLRGTNLSRNIIQRNLSLQMVKHKDIKLQINILNNVLFGVIFYLRPSHGSGG